MGAPVADKNIGHCCCFNFPSLFLWSWYFPAMGFRFYCCVCFVTDNNIRVDPLNPPRLSLLIVEVLNRDTKNTAYNFVCAVVVSIVVVPFVVLLIVEVPDRDADGGVVDNLFLLLLILTSQTSLRRR